MNKQEKLDKIYEVIADKTLSFGCKLHMEEQGEEGYGYYIHEDEHFLIQSNREWSLFEPSVGYDYTIIGHQVMIGDAIDRIRKQENLSRGEIGELIARNRGNTRLPINDQSESVIEKWYNLVKDH